MLPHLPHDTSNCNNCCHEQRQLVASSTRMIMRSAQQASTRMELTLQACDVQIVLCLPCEKRPNHYSHLALLGNIMEN